uniref:Mediator of RNA polymerase II transcription subunit 23 n=2 Tax=Macrostomum lignano TaxID=282301 RepID=A0A1I8GRT3_9PLAT
EDRKRAVKLYISHVMEEFLDRVHICDELLVSHDDIMRNPAFFKEAVTVMDRLVRQMDYKGCRDLFGKVLGLYKTFSEGEDKVFVPAFKILKTKLETFRNSFKNVANMFSHRVIRQIVPIAGVGNYCMPPAILQHPQPSSVTNVPVNLLASTGALDLKGPLPYARCLQRPHTSLIRAVLTQQGSMDLLLSLLSLHTAPRASKISRCLFLERCLIDTILWTADETEACESDSEMAWADMMWRHLGLYSIHLCRLHLVRFPEMCLGVLEGLQDRRDSLSRSAPHIAWMLFNFLGAQNKNPLVDFAPILRILDALFPGGAPAFDTTLLVWFSLTQKSSAPNERLPRALPPPMQPMMSELMEKFQQMSQSPSYQVPLDPEEFRWFAYVYNAYAPLGQPQVVSPLNSKLVEALKQSDAIAPSYSSLRQLATMSLLAINSLLYNLLSTHADSPVVLDTYARITVLMHHDLNLQPKSVLTEAFTKAGNTGGSRVLAFVFELATYHLNSVEPMQRHLLLQNLVTLAKANRLGLDTELCLYRQAQALLTPALQVTNNHVKKLYVAWICGSDQEELNKYLLLQINHQLIHQQADPDGLLLSDFVQPLFQKCSAACLVPISMQPRLLASPDRISVPSAERQSHQLTGSAELATRLSQRILQEGQCDEAQLSDPSAGCLYWVALSCLRERGGDLPAAQLFARVQESLGPKGALPHLRIFCDLLTREVASAADNAEVSALHHVTSLVYTHRLFPLHRLLLVLLMRPFAERRLELAAFRVLRHLLSADTPNSPMAGLVPVLNSFPPSGGANGSLSALVSQLRQVYDDTPGGSSSSASLYSHAAIRVALLMDTALARLVQLQPPDSCALLSATLAPFLRHMPAPGTCLISLLSVYDPPAPLRLYLAAALLAPRMEAAADGAYLPSDCLPFFKSLLASPSLPAPAAQASSSDWLSCIGPPEAALNRLSLALSSHGRRGFPQLDWFGHEWPSSCSHAVNCCALQLLLCPVDLPAPVMPPRTAGLSSGFILSSKSKPHSNRQSDGGAAAKKARLEAEQDAFLDADDGGDGEEDDEGGGEESEDADEDEVDKLDWQSAGLLLAQMPARFTTRLVQQPLLALYDQLSGAAPHKALGHELASRPEVCLWFAYLSHAGPGRVAQLPNELVAELYHCLAEVDAACSGRLEHQDALADYFYHIKYMFVGDGVRRVASSVIERLSPSMQSRLRSIAPGHQPDGPADAPNFPAQSEN